MRATPFLLTALSGFAFLVQAYPKQGSSLAKRASNSTTDRLVFAHFMVSLYPQRP
jgi:hypothetical protein